MLLSLLLQLGPVLGDVTETGATVWCRLAVSTPVQVIYGTDPLLAGASLSVDQVPMDTNDWTLHVQLAGLQAETRYYYALVAPGLPLPNQTATFDFWTAPPAGTQRAFSFVVFADASQSPLDPGSAYTAAASGSPAFALQIGDLDHRNPATQGTLAAWRAMHRDHLGGLPQGAALAALAARAPLYHIWDDHDYGDNNEDGTAPWKSRAMRAFREYFPCPPLPSPMDGNYYSFTWAEAEFFVLDCRFQRSPNLDPDGPAKTMLGPAQLAWLQAGLQGSQARWKFLVSSSCWNPHGKPVDSWALYGTEQAAILAAAAGVPGIIVISGDIHSSGAIDDGTNSFWPEVSVPATNMPYPPSGCTGGQGCGTWSQGALNLGPPSGYCRVDVEPSTVTLNCLDSTGSVVLSYTVR